MKNVKKTPKKPNGEMKTESLIPFPCEFTIKIIGKSDGQFEKNAIIIIEQHFPSLDHSRIERRFSKDKRYLSLSVTVFANTKTELDAAYQALSNCEDVLVTL